VNFFEYPLLNLKAIEYDFLQTLQYGDEFAWLGMGGDL